MISQACGCQRRGVGKEMTGDLGLADKLLYTERINDEVPLYSTWNYIQYPVIKHNGKEHEKYTYKTESLLYSRCQYIINQLYSIKN